MQHCRQESRTSRWSSGCRKCCPTVLGWSGHPRRRPPQGRVGPGCAVDRGGPLLPVRVLPAVADRRRLAARNLSVVGPARIPAAAADRRDGEPVLVELTLPDEHELRARVWIAQVGRVPFLLFDSDVPRTIRIAGPSPIACMGARAGPPREQETAGWRRRRAGPPGVTARRPGVAAREVFHTNEGPRRLPRLERIRELMKGSELDFERRCRPWCGHGVHDAHARPGRHRPFPRTSWLDLAVMPGVRWIASSHSAPSMTRPCSTWRTWGFGWLSAPTASHCCTARVSREMFARCGRDSTPDEVPIGVGHQRCARLRPGSRRSGSTRRAASCRLRLARAGRMVWERIQQVTPASLWRIRRQLREQLVNDVRRRLTPLVAPARRPGSRIRLDRSRFRPRRADDRASPAGCRPTRGSP